jgi:hypothetical protein
MPHAALSLLLAQDQSVPKMEGHPLMAGENSYSVEECYRRANEARRLADSPGIPPEEKADLIAVERRWLALARSYRING